MIISLQRTVSLTRKTDQLLGVENVNGWAARALFFFQSTAQLQYVEDSEPVSYEVNVTIGEQCKNKAALRTAALRTLYTTELFSQSPLH